MTSTATPAEAFQLRSWERQHLDERGLKPVPFELTAEQVAAMDETMGHVATVPSLRAAQVSPESQSVVADSTRAGEGG